MHKQVETEQLKNIHAAPSGNEKELHNSATLIPGVEDAYVFAQRTEQGRENVILALVAGDVMKPYLCETLQQRLENPMPCPGDQNRCPDTGVAGGQDQPHGD